MTTATLAANAARFAAEVARVDQIAANLGLSPQIDHQDDAVMIVWHSDDSIVVITAVTPGEPLDHRMLVGGQDGTELPTPNGRPSL